MEVLKIWSFQWSFQEFVKKFSASQRNLSNERDVQIIGSQIIESLLQVKDQIFAFKMFTVKPAKRSLGTHYSLYPILLNFATINNLLVTPSSCW